MDYRNRRYFIVNFSGISHNMRVDIVKDIPSVKIRRDSYYSGRNQMMIGCSKDYCEALLYEIRKAKRNDGFCTCVEFGYTIAKDIFSTTN